MVKNLPASAGDLGSVPGLGRQIDPLEKEMATHSSILAGEIPWTEEASGLYNPWSRERIRHGLVTETSTTARSFLRMRNAS